ncbi:hypothetical protein EJ06DRAFT_527586 [Trichodelitschia bisporula]|uniref:C3H1-type domain-containing protein n=1 Tax=Trichodelitschia bisporula TaxID=703511 RepID=A0A6G1I7J2_9PEZI|nr:hypothetical protein EJ06DRAFT_527586 [Trichodelitschia bisporula]
MTGTCTAGAACDLSHDPTPNRVPACVHFLRGNCNNDSCRYAHVKASPSALICRPFATMGYCKKGAKCQERHLFECPDYAEHGECKTQGCRLPHVDRANQLRRKAARSSLSPELTSDNDSEDEGAVDSSGDVDMDVAPERPTDALRQLEEHLNGFSQQQDYIGL